MIGYYNYSVILTYFGLSTSVVGMFQAFRGNLKFAVLCLMISGICDMFDGTIARRCKRTEDEKAFGIQIDSLCDLICFGAFPAVIVFNFMSDIESFNFWLTIFCIIFYVLAAVIRLGYFNVSEINRTAVSNEKRVYYEGLPVTSVSLLLPLFLVLDFLLTKGVFVKFYNIGLLLIGILFISKLKIKKPYFKGLLLVSLIGAIVFTLVIIIGGQFNA
jgi:CDP-diacylglycerol--serine O-phosphatidyltransferase